MSELPECNNKEQFFIKHELDPNKKLISIFPGSRTFEIKHLLKIFLEAAKIISSKRDDVQFVVSHAPSLAKLPFETPYKQLQNENRELLAYSDALILASGTVALEAAMYETPMIIAYRGPLFFYLVYLLLRNIKKACLVNIITGTDYVDEFLMYDAEPIKIASSINRILDDENKKNHIVHGCKKVKKLLGETHCVEKTAQIIYEELNKDEKDE